MRGWAYVNLLALALLVLSVALCDDVGSKTCSIDDKDGACSAERESKLRKELLEIEEKKQRIEERLKKKNGSVEAVEAKSGSSDAEVLPVADANIGSSDAEADAKVKEEEARVSEEAKRQAEQASAHAREMDERRKAGSTWIMPKEKPRASGKCSLNELDACTDAEKRLLRARPPALLPDGTYSSALVQSSSGSGALTVKVAAGDDCLEQFLLTQSELRNKASGVFVDIGAGNGVKDSRTRKFETLRGWTGLCIEPHEELHEELKGERKCTALKVAVGRDEGTRKFSSKARKLSATGDRAVDVKPLGKLLHDANYVGKHIDLLRVSTNGTEMDVLRSIDLAKATIETISLPPLSEIHHRAPRYLNGLGWANVVTDEAAIEACPELATLFSKHFWPTPPEWKDLVLNWLSPIPRSWQSQNGMDILLRLENFPADEKMRREMEMLITTQRLKVHLFWNGLSIGVYGFRKEKKDIPKPTPKVKGKPKKEARTPEGKALELAKAKEIEEALFYYDYEVHVPIHGLKIHSGRHTLWARLINRDGNTPTGLENSTNFIVCETPGPFQIIMNAMIAGENCQIDDWLEEGEGQEFYSPHGSLSVKVEKDQRLAREQEEWRAKILQEKEEQRKREEEEKRRCEAGETEFCPKKVVIDDVKETPAETPASANAVDEVIEVDEEKVEEKPKMCSADDKDGACTAAEKLAAEEKPAGKAKKGKKGDAKKDEKDAALSPLAHSSDKVETGNQNDTAATPISSDNAETSPVVSEMGNPEADTQADVDRQQDGRDLEISPTEPEALASAKAAEEKRQAEVKAAEEKHQAELAIAAAEAAAVERDVQLVEAELASLQSAASTASEKLRSASQSLAERKERLKAMQDAPAVGSDVQAQVGGDSTPAEAPSDPAVATPSTAVAQENRTCAYTHGSIAPDEGYAERLETFQKGVKVGEKLLQWPHSASRTLTAEIMAAAGLYFAPGSAEDEADKCVCKHCGLDLYGWEDGDDPFAEHRKNTPDCSYVVKHDLAMNASAGSQCNQGQQADAPSVAEPTAAAAKAAEEKRQAEVKAAEEKHQAELAIAAAEAAAVERDVQLVEAELASLQSAASTASEKLRSASQSLAERKERLKAMQDAPAVGSDVQAQVGGDSTPAEAPSEQPKKGKKGKKQRDEAPEAPKEAAKASGTAKPGTTEPKDGALDAVKKPAESPAAGSAVPTKSSSQDESTSGAEAGDAANANKPTETPASGAASTTKASSHDESSPKFKGKDKKGTATSKSDVKQLAPGKVEVGTSVAGKVSKGEVTVKEDTSLQASKVKNCTDNLGLEPDKPGTSCQDILDRSCDESPVNGFYWINVTDAKEYGKPLNRWRVVQTRCEMEFNHGGWTRVLVCSDGEDSPWNTFGEDDFLVNKYAVQYLAGNAQQILIRTYNRPDIFVVSVPGAAPIQLLRQGAPLNIPIHNDTDELHGVKNNWYGSMTHFMNWGKGTAEINMKLQYPQVVYWAANNPNGLHLVNQPEPASAKMVKANLGTWQKNFMTTNKDKICAWTLQGWHPIASVQRGSLPTTFREKKKPHAIEDGRGLDSIEVFVK